ncbi:MAG: hypothetical protein KGI54_09425 [Pseudomonadota bacterium]|nr:hypothetical protein [Pseudomonadota bacterium]
MDMLADILTYIRRIIKAPSNSSIPDSLLIDYVNRFWIMDVDARIQLFDLKTVYQFETIPGVDQYNMPLYQIQTETTNPTQEITPYPVYQGFLDPCFVNGIPIGFGTERGTFWNAYPKYLQALTTVGVGDGSTTQFTFNLPFNPAIPGHVDLTGIVLSGSTTDPIFTSSFIDNIPTTSVKPGVFLTYTDSVGNTVSVTDSGQFLNIANPGQNLYGLLMSPGSSPMGNAALSGGYDLTTNTVNYNTGVVNVTFPSPPPAGANIQAQCYFYEQGIPRVILYYDNTITIRPPPNTQYLVELTAYLSPAAFLQTTNAIQFAYMCEYIARGAARKILSDTGDVEQLQMYEPFFKEQEMLVWKRSQRQFTSTRTQTIFSTGGNYGGGNNMNIGTS